MVMLPGVIAWVSWVAGGGTTPIPSILDRPRTPSALAQFQVCYKPDLTEAQWLAILDWNNGLPAAHQHAPDERFESLPVVRFEDESGNLVIGDANYDLLINFSDITGILENWARLCSGGLSGPGDANGDDAVSFADITNVLENWGASCP